MANAIDLFYSVVEHSECYQFHGRWSLEMQEARKTRSEKHYAQYIPTVLPTNSVPRVHQRARLHWGKTKHRITVKCFFSPKEKITVTFRKYQFIIHANVFNKPVATNLYFCPFKKHVKSILHFHCRPFLVRLILSFLPLSFCAVFISYREQSCHRLFRQFKY